VEPASWYRNCNPRLGPRPTVGLGPSLFVQPKGYTLPLYRALLPVHAGQLDRLKLKIYDEVGHELSPGMMEDVTDWFAAHLLP
jgi:hypothetical protein